MPKLINRYGVVDKAGTDGWIEYTGDASVIPVGASAAAAHRVPRVRRHLAETRGDNGALGVKLTPRRPALIAGELDKLALIAIEFPACADGRGYPRPHCCASAIATSASCAPSAMCCATRSFDVTRRFTTFALRDDQNVEKALAAFNDFGLLPARR